MIHCRSSAVAAADCRTLRSLLGLNPSTFPIQNVNLKQAIRELYLVCSFRTGNSRSNYIFKTIPLCDFFLELFFRAKLCEKHLTRAGNLLQKTFVDSNKQTN